MAAAKAVKVRVLPLRYVMVDGAQRGPGDIVAVPAEDAAALIADGFVAKA